MSARALALGAALALAAPGALAQSRPTEEDLFGQDEQQQPQKPEAAEPTAPAEPARQETRPNAPPAQPPGVDTAGREERRDEDVLSGAGARDAFQSEEAVNDPLEVGGQFYLRALTQGRENTRASNTPFSAPTLIDGYFDARPTDRLRGMVVARLSYDPTVLGAQGGTTSTGTPDPGATSGEAVSAGRSNPAVLLDQAWLRFDIARAVFVTVGKQHVKWGASRFWNPTDFLTPQRRDPLAQFDARTGASMVKLHVPWERHGWNFYALALLDNAGPADTLSRIGGAARAEVVFGTAELGLDAVLQRGRKPRFGADLSAGVGPFDVYGEVALKRGTDAPVFRVREGVDLGAVFDQVRRGEPVDLSQLPEEYTPTGLTPQASGGVTYQFAYTDKDVATVGVEYFYNSTGYTNRLAYPFLLLRGGFTPFYAGRHYGAAYLTGTVPGTESKTNLVLSTLGNLSDRSYITRLDVLHRALSYLTVELFAAVNYGTRGGEFRFATDVPSVDLDGPGPQAPTPPLLIQAPTLQLGAGLRITL